MNELAPQYLLHDRSKVYQVLILLIPWVSNEFLFSLLDAFKLDYFLLSIGEGRRGGGGERN